ncbi:MAG: DNA adenine methylase [Holosporales bacterium]|jgi:DNA adenine methylase|nr:DNA adenine methylase [Holosporales bacterium]
MARQQTIPNPLGVDFNDTLRLIADEQMLERHDIARPFVKWVGGKRSIIGDLLSRIPEEFNTYFEPFVGGGALFWNIPRQGNAYLADINFHLIITYRMIRDNVEAVISRLEYHKKNHSEKYYLEARGKLSDTEEPIEIASLFIYLNKTCYNGLYRVNRSGTFNVPMGRYSDPKIVDSNNLRKCSKFLADVDIFQHGFSQIKPKKRDFIYFDPPYHETFSAYDGSGFGDKEHKQLADFCRRLDASGVLFMLSNSDTPFIRQLYDGYNMVNVDASRFISCKGNERKKENELIIRNYIQRNES